MSVKLRSGVRYIESDCLGLAVGGRVVNFGVNGIWVDCIECGRRDRLAGEKTAEYTDEQAKEIFEARGWTVLPTRCPECRIAQEAKT